MKNEIKSMLGYESPHDFFTTLFGLHYNILNTFTAFVAVLTTFITNYIWDSSLAVYSLLSLMIFDWAMGTGLAIRATYILKVNKELSIESKSKLLKRRLSSKRAPRIFVAIIIAFWLLSTAWNLSKSSMLFYPLPGIVYGGFATTYLMSLVENLTEAGFFPKSVISLLQDKLDITKYFKK